MPAQDPQGCPCDRISFPPKPEISAGLSALPRQLAGFPEFRQALLGEIRAHKLLDDALSLPLADWRAREGDDFGVMLLEMWAYVLDVLGFYDERIANESYLRTAGRPESLLRLVELIGYHPRPALAARVTLALLAEDGNGPVAVPRGVAFRSGPFGDETPQVFETVLPATIDPRRNEWTLAPIRPAGVGTELFLNPNEAAIDRMDLVLVRWGNGISQMEASRVIERSTVQALDGNPYVRLHLTKSLALPPRIETANVGIFTPTLDARVHDLRPNIVTISGGPAAGTQNVTIIRLESLQNDLTEGDQVILVRGQETRPARVTSVAHSQLLLSSSGAAAPSGPVQKSSSLQPTAIQATGFIAQTFQDSPSPGIPQPHISVTILHVEPPVPPAWNLTPARVRIHFRLVEAGRLTRPAKHRISLGDVAPMAAFEGISEPLEPSVRPNEVLLLGNDGLGARLAAAAKVDDDGVGRIEPEVDATQFPAPLRTPVRVFGNLVEATRGESVVNEVLGTGNAAMVFQKFILGKTPLTHLSDPSAPDGRRSTLEIRVNGLLWTEVPSFFGVGPEDEVYTVRRDPESGRSIVTFGNGEMGARLQTGAHIVANYRFGAGAAAPPANSITQLTRPVPGIRGAENPVSAGGGADGDRPKDLRRNAPDSALLLGRAVSLQDFEALAREFGVVNAHVDWAWDGTIQRAVVKIWFIPNSDAIAEENERELKATLLALADPNTPLRACQAQAILARLLIDLVVEPRHNSDEVELAVAEALTNPETGLLALENIPIGGPLFRSALFEQILSVDGAESVRAMTFNGQPFGATRTPKEGRYYNFLPQMRVGSSAAGDRLFANAGFLNPRK